MTPAAVATASSLWNWYPTDAETLATEHLLLVRWPHHHGTPPGLIRVDPVAAVDDTLDRALAQARAWGASEMLVWVKLDAPPDLEPTLAARGARRDETVDALALDLARRPDLAVPVDLRVRWQVDVPTTRAAIEVGIAAFDEGAMPPDDRLEALAAEAADAVRDGREATALVYVEDRPVACGGLTVVDGVARLWGGGVVPGARGRGAYRAVLDARLRHAITLGASMALVKGRVDTSGPILRRAGFDVNGQERSYVLAL